jgi:hypothetical protein
MSRSQQKKQEKKNTDKGGTVHWHSWVGLEPIFNLRKKGVYIERVTTRQAKQI